MQLSPRLLQIPNPVVAGGAGGRDVSFAACQGRGSADDQGSHRSFTATVESPSDDDERDADAHVAPAPGDDHAVERDNGASGDQIPNEPIAPHGDAMNEAEQRVLPEVDATTVPLPVGESECNAATVSDEEGAELDVEAVDYSAHVEPGDDDEWRPPARRSLPLQPTRRRLSPNWCLPSRTKTMSAQTTMPRVHLWTLVGAEPGGGGGAEEPVALDGAYDTEAFRPAHVEQDIDEPVEVSANATSASAVALGDRWHPSALPPPSRTDYGQGPDAQVRHQQLKLDVGLHIQLDIAIVAAHAPGGLQLDRAPRVRAHSRAAKEHYGRYSSDAAFPTDRPRSYGATMSVRRLNQHDMPYPNRGSRARTGSATPSPSETLPTACRIKTLPGMDDVDAGHWHIPQHTQAMAQ
ncbi:hypothetical protein AURDEDRAFT_177148 [Auricularia subglabra TFB-10046 SS5]|uniref:Uncharacterized protein n=1 Tax=Auricularia subglabra (strain TFB-10046 / SS5) TaxID=717982 RepID=J0LBE8_AURST|nr:hypothetical protein AURDEDRAFT_177148 [Auricularia subglabra TFB-10046 SS5]